jgi:hypothetical protein
MVAEKVPSSGSALGKKDEILGRVFKLGPDDVLGTEVLFIRNVLGI